MDIIIFEKRLITKIMKKLTIFILIQFLFVHSNLFSQIEYAITLEDLQGNSYSDNHTLEFSSIDYPDASFTYKIRNNTNETIRARVEVESLSGTDGSMMELCFGECYFGVNLGQSYPINNAQPYVYIAAGDTQIADGDHFFNTDPGSGDNPVEYTFRFYVSDENGDEILSQAELQTDFTIHYFYSSSLGLEDIANNNIMYYYSNDKLTVKTDSKIFIKLYSLNGKLFLQKTLNQGLNSIDIQHLKQKNLILSFETTANNKISIKKIIVP